MTKIYIKGPNITLQDFYVWMGRHFFMAGFEGIKNNKIWWLEKPIDMFEGEPFRLSEYMSGRRFQNIGAAICYTNSRGLIIKGGVRILQWPYQQETFTPIGQTGQKPPCLPCNMSR